MQKTQHCSYTTGKLAPGCKLCVQGKKEVIFITGLCSEKCFFCPLSEQKKNRDVIYANEWPVQNLKDIITEAELCESKGAGITGGDPMIRLSRTVKVIRMLKQRFGKRFHIHLYTPLTHVTVENLKRLHRAGLDEIRFHPKLDNKKLWNRIGLASQFSWSVGVEIPAIPGTERQTKELIDFIEVDFLNLNELEISTTNAEELLKRGFVAKDRSSYAIKGSEELALRLLRYCETKGTSTHYCTTKLKDSVQLAKRIKRRARNVAKPYDHVTREGMLIRGAVYLQETIPGFSYRKRMQSLDKRKTLEKLKKLRHDIAKLGIDKKMLAIDDKKLRILTSTGIARKLSKHYPCAIVEEYPTWDQFEVEVEMLRR
ncbi:MAG: radical SAM protein [Candidatus Woesearchaeota archaeon]